MSGSKLLDGNPLYEPDMKYWQIKHTGWFHPSFEPDMKYWQIEHTGWLNPKMLSQSWSTDKLNIQGDSIIMSGSKHLDWITPYVELVSTSCLVENFWIESPCMFNLSVLHVWLKILDWNTLYVQVVNTFQNCWTRYEVDKMNIQGDSIQRFWTRYEVLTSCVYFMSGWKILDWITLYV
jgi:hypothetical protein